MTDTDRRPLLSIGHFAPFIADFATNFISWGQLNIEAAIVN